MASETRETLTFELLLQYIFYIEILYNRDGFELLFE
jgi:hypothetical protein